MKKILTIGISAIALTSVVYGQGTFDYANSSGAAAGTQTIKVGTPSAAGEGTLGQFVGSTYRASLYYELGTVSGSVDPSTLTSSGITTSFFGATGGAPNVDGAGIFDFGTATIPSTSDGTQISVEVAVWFAGAGANSYASAKALGYNVGLSSLVPIKLATGSTPIQDLSAMPNFTVSTVPEPATIALGGLGAAALLLFRRRK